MFLLIVFVDSFSFLFVGGHAREVGSSIEGLEVDAIIGFVVAAVFSFTFAFSASALAFSAFPVLALAGFPGEGSRGNEGRCPLLLARPRPTTRPRGPLRLFPLPPFPDFLRYHLRS